MLGVHVQSTVAVLHEARFVASFVVAEKRERWLNLLGKPARRRKLTSRLAHSAYRDFEARWCREVPRTASLVELLIARGAPRAQAYVISEDSGFDGRVMPLAEVLDGVHGYGMGTIVSCVPGELAIYEAEHDENVLLLHRPSQ